MILAMTRCAAGSSRSPAISTGSHAMGSYHVANELSTLPRSEIVMTARGLQLMTDLKMALYVAFVWVELVLPGSATPPRDDG